MYYLNIRGVGTSVFPHDTFAPPSRRVGLLTVVAGLVLFLGTEQVMLCTRFLGYSLQMSASRYK